MLKNKNVVIAVVAVLLLIIGAGVFFFTQTQTSTPDEDNSPNEKTIKTLQPEDIGLELSLIDNNREAVIRITKLDGIQSIEYETSYDAEEEDPESGEATLLTQGATSGDPIEVAGESEIERQITLGTCSRNVCRYHDVKSDINFIVKVNFEDGTIGQVEDTLPYPQAE